MTTPTAPAKQPPRTARAGLRRLLRPPALLPGLGALALALALSACGGSPASSGSSGVASASGTATTSPAATSGSGAAGASGAGASGAGDSAKGLAFAACMRSHGVPSFPDSAITVTAHGVLMRLTKSSGLDPSSPTFTKADQACQHLLPQAATGSHASAAAVAELVKFAQCMRSHGVPKFPEPSSSGRLQFRAGPGTGIDPSSPQYRAARRACKSLEPAGFQGGPLG